MKRSLINFSFNNMLPSHFSGGHFTMSLLLNVYRFNWTMHISMVLIDITSLYISFELPKCYFQNRKSIEFFEYMFQAKSNRHIPLRRYCEAFEMDFPFVLYFVSVWSIESETQKKKKYEKHFGTAKWKSAWYLIFDHFLFNRKFSSLWHT